ncbi:DUF4158 domain-containing protein [Rhizobium leguminosarum]|nr:DUF4158 domain-containing protein [Rhizobium leguminosarum]NEK33001.1 DUF4158 domain-containing protein [Rhizobium leguminosarum]
MGRRKLPKVHERQELFSIPTDEENLIRRYSLSLVERLGIEVRRRHHNQLGIAVQLCLMRYPGRVLKADEFRRERCWDMSLSKSDSIPHRLNSMLPRPDASRSCRPIDNLFRVERRNGAGSPSGAAFGDRRSCDDGYTAADIAVISDVFNLLAR